MKHEELKWKYLDELYREKYFDKDVPPVYLKSEADKVIADLDESHKMEVEQLLIEIAELQKQVRDYAQGLYVIQARAEKEARHHKYKRCLDKADYWGLVGAFTHGLIQLKCMRREMKWRKLAEKFKEAK